MSVIKTLPEAVARQIAAGEVVERPASVVKELIENALDAGSQCLRIATVGAGVDLIEVHDDGCGMSREDAEMAPRNFAYTSGPTAASKSQPTRTIKPTAIAMPVARCRIDVAMVTGQR